MGGMIPLVFTLMFTDDLAYLFNDLHVRHSI